jgi:hypothetical protein
MSTFLTTVVTHTPLWVWGLLAGLVALGLRQSRDRVLSLRQVLLLPAAMGTWAFFSATQVFGGHLPTVAAWLAGLGLGYALNRWLMLPRRVQALADGRFAIDGSWAPMVLFLTIFMVRYAVSASLAVVPELATLPIFAAVACALYGLPSGLLAARAQRVLQARAQKPSAPMGVHAA